eukprot:403360010
MEEHSAIIVQPIQSNLENSLQQSQIQVKNQINQLKLSQSLVPFSDEDFILIQHELLQSQMGATINQSQQKQAAQQHVLELNVLVDPIPKVDESMQPLIAKMHQKLGNFSRNLFSKITKSLKPQDKKPQNDKTLKQSQSTKFLQIQQKQQMEAEQEESKVLSFFKRDKKNGSKTQRDCCNHISRNRKQLNQSQSLNDFVYIDNFLSCEDQKMMESTEDTEFFYDPVNWTQMLRDRKFNFTQDRELYSQIKREVCKSGGLDNLNRQERQNAWLLMLGIDTLSQQYRNYQELYYDFVLMYTDKGTQQDEIEKLIAKDVHRTFADQNLYQEPPESGSNRLYNLLRAYSLYDPDVSYMQGMNFIAALVLNLFEDDALAWMVFIRILQINEWKRLYIENTPKLFELCTKIREFIQIELPQLHIRIQHYQIPVEPLIAAAFITIFSNLLSIDRAQLSLERFVLMGENFVLGTLQKLFKKYHDIMIDMDAWELQVFIGRKMYQYSQDNDSFFSNE